jgi:hydrogenase maturation protease
MKTLVLGVGNTLLADEGAGVYAMQFLKEQYDLPDTEFLDGGTLSFTLTGAIAEATNLIIFDAAQLDGDPGYVRVFEGAEFQDFLMSGCHSVHEVGFADLMDITRLMDCLPDNCALIGIQPEYVDWSDRPGEAVREAIPKAAACAAALIRKWQDDAPAKVMLQ